MVAERWRMSAVMTTKKTPLAIIHSTPREGSLRVAPAGKGESGMARP